jgi:L-alanine-DL-glutamate epimerase-like enolase superfamily enzyme
MTQVAAPADDIARVDATVVSIPVDPPAGFATRLITHREYVIVQLTSLASEHVGVGYAYAGTSGGNILAAVIDELIRPQLLGRDVFAVEKNWADVYQELLLLGRRGLVVRALSAVDIATWDLISKILGKPLRSILGGGGDSVAAYASGGYYRPGDPIANVVDEVKRYQELGFTDFKLKFGGLALGEDLERVKAARTQIGPAGRLALDINNGWRDTTEAMRAIAALVPLDIWWVEEPFSPDDVRSHMRLNERSPIPIATGEIEATHWAFADLLERRAAEILQPDACVCGGVTEWMKIARSAETYGVLVAPHWHANLHAQLAAVVPNCLPVEYFAPPEGIYNLEAIMRSPLTVTDGRIVLPSEPGIGVEFDSEAVAGFTTRAPAAPLITAH